ncbi:4-hydroxybenzoate polyprenyltransferase [Flavobacterium noncentrifugens]|uniref:4-hydroxybenzoate polyprenyltransferase n=2 Tax=Flavobacterium noncentrifugens TaxID=1128970 RepID=A0A1G8WL55_9FLAO|nr:4-hydroxybenzoate polyprenyltransferase [Flavobacterium noncentrifugens]
MQLILRYGFLIWQKIPLALNDFQYILLVFSTVLIAAAGYVINNIFDQETDGENKPKHVIVGKYISEAMAYNIYVGLNISGVAIGFYLANVIEKPGFAAIFIFIAATLYLYATSLKQMLVVGNVIIALLLAVSVLIVPVFDMFPMIYNGNREVMATVFSVISDYAVFAFILNLIREMVKDLEDVDGDYNQGMNTLPIALGRKRTSKLIFGLSIVPVLLVLYYTNKYFFSNNLLLITIYILLFVAAPLIYFTVKMWDAKSVKDFRHLSLVLKLVILFGVFSIALLTYNILHHA